MYRSQVNTPIKIKYFVALINFVVLSVKKYLFLSKKKNKLDLKMNFVNRKIINKIKAFLNYKEAILIYGARQVGKTTIIKILIEHLQNEGQSKNSIFYFDLEDLDYLNIFNQGIESVKNYIDARTDYKGKIYLYVDEIQYLENASSFIKLLVDNYSEKFKLIASGSSVIGIKSKITQSLVGRVVTFEVFGLDFEEFLWFKNKKINIQKVNDLKSEKELKELFNEFTIYGFYPRIAKISKIAEKKYYLKELIQTYIKKDIKDIGKIRNIIKFNNFLRILADRAGNLINIDSLSVDAGIARETVYDYLMLLENTYIIAFLRPYYKNLRSELIKMPKIYFLDNGVLNYLKYNDVVEKISGDLFENIIFSELRKTFDREKIKFWRTQAKNEVDFIIETGNEFLTIEAKKSYAGEYLKDLNYFASRYSRVKKILITLDRKKTGKKDINVIYPWEIRNYYSDGS